MSSGIKISKSGIDVATAGEEDLYLISQTPLLRLYKSGSGVVNLPYLPPIPEGYNTFTTEIIYHNLGYIPYIYLYMDRQPGGARRIVSSQDNEFSVWGTQIFCIASIYKNRIDIRISRIAGTGVTPLYGKFGYNYFIFENKVV